MLINFYEHTPKKVLVLGVLGFIAITMGWGVISPYFDDTKEIRKHCKSLSSDVISQLNLVNTCDSNEDCTQAVLPCPFSCDAYVNKNASLDGIKQAVHAYNKECGYCAEECAGLAPVCVNHQCISFATLPTEEDQHEH